MIFKENIEYVEKLNEEITREENFIVLKFPVKKDGRLFNILCNPCIDT